MVSSNRLLDLFGVELPIIQAPMAGATSSEMVVAVSNAGGLGSLPTAVYSEAQLRAALDTVRAGRARNIVKPGQVFSRIHVADIVQVLIASIERPSPGRAYNLCDDEAAPPADVILYACELLGVAPPPPIAFAEAALSPMARSFYDDNKRVHNDRIKRELGVKLLYPTYRQGLAEIFAAERSSIR